MVPKSMLGVLLLVSYLSLGSGKAFSPPVVLPPLDIIDPEDLSTAIKVLPVLAPFFGAGPDCPLDLKNILSSRKQTRNGSPYRIMELKVSSSCNPEAKICSGIQVPADCENCLEELVNIEEIQCVPDIIVDPGFIFGGFIEIPDPSSNPSVRVVAEEATKFLYGHFDTSSPCPVHLKEIIRARQQAVKGFNYEFELQVETNGADFNCEHVIKTCKNVQMHEPFAENCPHGEKNCVIPVGLEDVDCAAISTIQNQEILIGGFREHRIDEEIIEVAKGVASKMASSFGVSHPTCLLNAERVVTAKSQVVAGTNFLLDIEFSSSGPDCEAEVKICRHVKVFRPLPFSCGESEGCLTLSEPESIECSPVDQTDFHKAIAEEAANFLYHLFEVDNPCLVEVKSHRISTNGNSFYDAELSLQTKEGQENCDFVMKTCKNIHLRKLEDSTCPYSNRPCVIPVRLNEAQCLNDF